MKYTVASIRSNLHVGVASKVFPAHAFPILSAVRRQLLWIGLRTWRDRCLKTGNWSRDPGRWRRTCGQTFVVKNQGTSLEPTGEAAAGTVKIFIEAILIFCQGSRRRILPTFGRRSHHRRLRRNDGPRLGALVSQAERDLNADDLVRARPRSPRPTGRQRIGRGLDGQAGSGIPRTA